MEGAHRQALRIRPATPADGPAIWRILEPIIRAGETNALDRDMGEDAALAYWTGPGKTAFVAEEDGWIAGTYFIQPNQAGGGRHVCNGGYVTAMEATGRGIARRMCLHSLEQAQRQGFKAMQFNFVVSTNVRAVRLWESLGFAIAGRLPQAFAHPVHGYVDALIMFRAL